MSDSVQDRSILVNDLSDNHPPIKDTEELRKKLKELAIEYHASDDNENHVCLKVPIIKVDGEYYIGQDSKNSVKLPGFWYEGVFDKEDSDKNITESWNIWMDVEYLDPDNFDGVIMIVQRTYEDDGTFDYNRDSIALGENPIDKVVEPIKELTTFAKKVIHNKVGTLLNLALDIIKSIFGDFPQFIINMAVTASDGSFKDWQLLYSFNDLKDNGKDGNKNMYTRVGDYSEGNKKKWQIAVKDIKKDGDEYESFSNETEIPVIKADLYNIAMGHIPLIDTNFLTGNETHSENSAWTILRNIASEIIHITIYIAAAILLITLIFTGVQIIRFSFVNPVTEAEYKERLADFTKSVLTLISSVVIMALCIFGSNEFFSLIQRNNNTYELPIRVNVENAEYSFSTTMAGYAGYMASSQNIDKTSTKAFYTFCYIVLVGLNVIAIVFMIIRMLILLVLSIVGPISAALTVFDISGPMSYRNWIIIYVILSAVQILMAIGCMIAMKMDF